MAIQGLRATDDYITQFHDRPENWREGILISEPNGTAPLFALTALMKKRVTDDPRFWWFEEDMPDYRVTLAGDLDAVAGNYTVSIASGALALKQGDLLYVENTGEILHVNSDPTVDGQATCARGFASTTVTAVDYDGSGVNPNLFLIGSTLEEGSSAPSPRTYNATERYNYTQILRNTFSLTRTAMKTKWRTGDAYKEDMRRCLTHHSMDIERALWFSKLSYATVNGRPRRTMAGIVGQITAPRIFTPSSGNMSMANLEAYLLEIFRYGSNEKMVFCGNNAMLGFQQAVRKNSSFNISPGIKEYGMNVTRFDSAFGSLVLKTHPLFNQLTGGTDLGASTTYTSVSSWAVVLDMAELKYVYLKDSDTKFEQDLQTPGVDGKEDGYISEISIQVQNVRHHAIIKGLTAGVADS